MHDTEAAEPGGKRLETRGKKQEARGKRQEGELGRINSYRDLLVYQRAYELALRTHELSLRLPDFERYELGKQFRTASKSIPALIAEGYGRRRYEKDFKRFLTDAAGSCDEMHVHLSLVADLYPAEKETAQQMLGAYDEVGRMLHGLTRSWRSPRT